MVVVVEHDRRLARRLVAALEARGSRVRLVHGLLEARALLADERPAAIYVSETLQRDSGGDLLAEIDRDARTAALPAVVRVSRLDSLFARAMRRGGLYTVVAPVDVEAAATMLIELANGHEGALRRLAFEAHRLHARAKDPRRRALVATETSRRLRRRSDGYRSD